MPTSDPMSDLAAQAEATAQELIERILTATDGLSAADLDASPFAESSPLFVIATHAISATEWNFVEVLARQTVDRSRQAEFESRAASVDDPLALLRERWAGAKAAIHDALANLDDDEWERLRPHQFMGRDLSGNELVCRALAHTAEHVGHAEMTRQWLDARSG